MDQMPSPAADILSPAVRARAAVMASLLAMIADGADFPGIRPMALALGLTASMGEYALRRLSDAGELAVESRLSPSGAVQRRVVMADGSATGWSNYTRGGASRPSPARAVAADNGVAKVFAPISAGRPVTSIKHAQTIAMAHQRRRDRADQATVPLAAQRAPRPQIEQDAQAIEAAMARSFGPLAALVDHEQIAGRRSSWTKALAALIEMGALCAEDARASDPADTDQSRREQIYGA